MSLILEALKKLEREKQAGARGLVVLSHLPWTGPRSGRTAIVGALVAVVAVAAGGAAVWRWRSAAGAPAVIATPPGPSPTAAPLIPDPGPAMPSARVAPPEQVDTRPVAVRPPAPPVSLLAPPRAEGGGPDPPADAPPGAREGPATGKAVELRLNAISVRDGHPVAILNDRLVREGDSFDGIRVLRIGDAEVEVEVAGQRRTLRF
ncbi:MAG: hypothetical protein E6J47_06620 [Chloroflexi bacterium]|nr:MAG: hypothetical protein E6J47_06620 [Chloroflexota bacterium]